MEDWKTSFLLGWPIFRGYVKLREGTGKGGVPTQLKSHVQPAIKTKNQSESQRTGDWNALSPRFFFK